MEKKAIVIGKIHYKNSTVVDVREYSEPVSFEDAGLLMDSLKEDYNDFARVYEESNIRYIDLSWVYDGQNFIFDSWSFPTTRNSQTTA